MATLLRFFSLRCIELCQASRRRDGNSSSPPDGDGEDRWPAPPPRQRVETSPRARAVRAVLLLPAATVQRSDLADRSINKLTGNCCLANCIDRYGAASISSLRSDPVLQTKSSHAPTVVLHVRLLHRSCYGWLVRRRRTLRIPCRIGTDPMTTACRRLSRRWNGRPESLVG
jgi:hypothetical protein